MRSTRGSRSPALPCRSALGIGRLRFSRSAWIVASALPARARAITHFETFRRGKFPFRGVSPGGAPCARAVPWRQALCPGERPGAGRFAHSEALRPRNHPSLVISPGQSPISRRFAGAKSHFGAFRQGERHAQGRRPGARHFALANARRKAICPFGGAPSAQSPIIWYFARAITHSEVLRPRNHPSLFISPGQSPISRRFAWANSHFGPFRRGERHAHGRCPGERPGAGHFAHSEALRPRNHPSLFISPGQSPISRRFAWANSHFGPFRRGERHAQGRCPGARHFALVNALAQGTLPIRRGSARAITHLFSFRPGNHPFLDVSPGQIPVSGRFAGASAVRKADALAQGTLPIWRRSGPAIPHLLSFRPDNHLFRVVSRRRTPIGRHFPGAATHFKAFLQGEHPAVCPGNHKAGCTLPEESPSARPSPRPVIQRRSQWEIPEGHASGRGVGVGPPNENLRGTGGNCFVWGGGGDESVRRGAGSQWMVAARPLCPLHCPVAYLSRLQRIRPAVRSD
jgi:hypothetical protein